MKTFQVELPIPKSYAVDWKDVSKLTEDGTIADDSEDTRRETAPDEPFSDQTGGETTDTTDLPEERAEASGLNDNVMAALQMKVNYFR